jgi:hypothetical protein
MGSSFNVNVIDGDNLIGAKFFGTIRITTLALGSRPRQRGLQACGPRGSLEITRHALGSVGKCEGMNPYTPKVIPTLGDGFPMDSQIFRGQFQGPKLNGLRISLHHWKDFET